MKKLGQASALSGLIIGVNGFGMARPEYSKGVVNRTPSTPFEYSGTCHPTPISNMDKALVVRQAQGLG